MCRTYASTAHVAVEVAHGPLVSLDRATSTTRCGELGCSDLLARGRHDSCYYCAVPAARVPSIPTLSSVLNQDLPARRESWCLLGETWACL